MPARLREAPRGAERPDKQCPFFFSVGAERPDKQCPFFRLEQSVLMQQQILAVFSVAQSTTRRLNAGESRTNAITFNVEAAKRDGFWNQAAFSEQFKAEVAEKLIEASKASE